MFLFFSCFFDQIWYIISHAMCFAALIALSLTTLWLEPRSVERMTIANLNFICHLLTLQDVHWEVPKGGFNTPHLRKY